MCTGRDLIKVMDRSGAAMIDGRLGEAVGGSFRICKLREERL